MTPLPQSPFSVVVVVLDELVVVEVVVVVTQVPWLVGFFTLKRVVPLLVIDAGREAHAVRVAAAQGEERAAAGAVVRRDDRDRAELAVDHRLDLNMPLARLLDLRRLDGAVLALRVLVLEALDGVAAPERLAGDGLVPVGSVKTCERRRAAGRADSSVAPLAIGSPTIVLSLDSLALTMTFRLTGTLLDALMASWLPRTVWSPAYEDSGRLSASAASESRRIMDLRAVG